MPQTTPLPLPIFELTPVALASNLRGIYLCLRGRSPEGESERVCARKNESESESETVRLNERDYK